MEAILKRFPFIEKIRAELEKIFGQEKEVDFDKKIINEMREVKKEIRSVQSRFNLFSDEELVDSTIYEENALNARYAYLLAIARKSNVKSEILSKK